MAGLSPWVHMGSPILVPAPRIGPETSQDSGWHASCCHGKTDECRRRSAAGCRMGLRHVDSFAK
jgi:hypothetical protein